MKKYSYVGSELELFRAAKNWKQYYYKMLRPYLGSEVLEVGAGMGSTTQVLCQQPHRRWVCLEPDPNLISLLNQEANLPNVCEIRQGFLTDLSTDEYFDSILYIDVLEHIEDDQAEIYRAASRLKPGGVLIVLSPAHQWLFSPFDQAIGHYRRYNRSMLRHLTVSDLKIVSLKYLDSVGLIASLSNRWLKQKMPTQGQIQLWDTLMVPLSRVFDPILQYAIGKSIIAVWRKE